MELIGETEVNITMTPTVPLGLPCRDLTFPYDHAVTGVASSHCQVYFREQPPERYEHTLRLRVLPAPGCNSYNSLLEFKPYTRPGPVPTMWMNYGPSNITVSLQYIVIRPCRICRVSDLIEHFRQPFVNLCPCLSVRLSVCLSGALWQNC